MIRIKNERKRIHEEFHLQTKIQKRIIKKNNFTYRKTIEVIEKNIPYPTNILDIGCGAGTIDFYLAAKGNTITGIDISENAISACKKTKKILNAQNTNFLTMNFPKEIPNEKYSLIIISEVIEHLEDDNLAIKQISKLLKKNGKMLLSTPSKNAPLYKMGLLNEFDKKVGHLRRYNRKELIELCTKNNLKVVYYEGTEGIVRNFLFTNPIAGKFVRFVKFFLSDFVTGIDNLSVKMFGESNHYIIAQKL